MAVSTHCGLACGVVFRRCVCGRVWPAVATKTSDVAVGPAVLKTTQPAIRSLHTRPACAMLWKMPLNHHAQTNWTAKSLLTLLAALVMGCSAGTADTAPDTSSQSADGADTAKDCGACSTSSDCAADTGCAACRVDSDCEAPATCNPQTWSCEVCPPSLAPHKRFWSDSKQTCVACLQDSDCGDPQADNRCLGNVCAVGDPCAVCSGQYPACAVIGDQWSCVECTSDADCAGKGSGTCSPITYTCSSVDVVWPQPHCQSDANCPPHPIGLLSPYCDAASKLCLDANGLCDNIGAFCPEGQVCLLKGRRDGYTYGQCEAEGP